MLPTVDFCGLKVTRLILGANPFAGYSHQNPQRDQAMLAYYTVDRIKETLKRAEAAGINTFITNNETPHVVQAVREYLADGGPLQWIAQVSARAKPPDVRANKEASYLRAPSMFDAIDEVRRMGCRALYFHGALVDAAYAQKDEEKIRSWCAHARAAGVPAGVAGHSPEAHLWADGLGIADFHAVCFFNCGSLHQGRGDRFALRDIAPAIACIRRVRNPCIAYKIMGAGRIDPRMAFEYAFGSIKPGDVVNVGMYRGDKDDIVEENAAHVRRILG
jgi:hypothetical protein